MDFSNKHPADPLFNSTFRGQPGYFKDEMGSSTLHQMIALRTKCYFLQAIPSPLLETAKKESFDNCYIKCKGAPIPRDALLKQKVGQSFINSLKNDCVGSIKFNTISCKNQTVMLEQNTKRVISSFCDKRKYAVCGNHTVSHYFTSETNISCPEPYECQFLQKLFNIKYNN